MQFTETTTETQVYFNLSGTLDINPLFMYDISVFLYTLLKIKAKEMMIWTPVTRYTLSCFLS